MNMIKLKISKRDAMKISIVVINNMNSVKAR